MLRRTLTKARLLASAAASARAAIVCLLVAGGLLASDGHACGAAEPEADKPVADELNAAEPPNAQPAGGKAPPAQAGGERPKALKGANVRVNQGIGPANAANAKTAIMLVQQWQPALIVELSFVRQICPDLPQPQRARVKAEGEKALLAAAEEAARAPNSTRSQGPGLQTMIRDALSEALHEALPADQWEHFAAEAAARRKRRQETVIRMVVEQLDEALYLTPEQRDQISRSLADHWQGSWEGWLQFRSARQLPALPADVVVPYLDPDQRQHWEKIPKVQVALNSIQVRNVNPADMAWWDEGMPKAKDAGAAGPRR